MKPSLSLRTAQHLTLTPQLQQSIRLLQLSTLELSQEVQQQLLQNPFLEVESGESDVSPSDPQEAGPETIDDGFESNESMEGAQVQMPDGGPDPHVAQDWSQLEEAPAFDASSQGDGQDGLPDHDPVARSLEESLAAFEGPIGKSSSQSAQDPDEDWLQARSAVPTLQDHLREQCAGLLIGKVQQTALLYLIDNLNDNGFLADDLADLAPDFAKLMSELGLTCLDEASSDVAQLAQALDALELALDQLQQMDPLGVGARDLPECLRLQLLARLVPASTQVTQVPHASHDAKIVAIAIKITRQPLEWVAKRDYRQLARLCHCTEAMTRQACELIKSLEPQPSRPFASTQLQEMVPDVVVRRLGSHWEVQINPQVMPRLMVRDFTAQVVSSEKLATHAPLQQALLDARWFVKSVAQRFETILRVSRCIVERQSGFFDKGPLALKPMVLREVADELGLHESTISRVTSSKFMATPQGTFELKYFFTSGLSSGGGQETSSTAVRALIRQWVDQENSLRPLSDQKLAEMLAEQGIACARRTVAKYREALKIPPTSMRRSH
jgi:RNA polymerase sigma-54 factor